MSYTVWYRKTDNKKWPYQLIDEYSYALPDSWPKLKEAIITPYVVLTTTHVLTLSKNYSWNGADVAIDTENIMRSSLVHDALCQLIGMGKLPFHPYRKLADEALYQVSRENGMGWVRATYVYYACRFYANAVIPVQKFLKLRK